MGGCLGAVVGRLLGTAKARGRHVEIDIDSTWTCCRNVSASSVTVLAVKRTGTRSESVLAVPSHFLKDLEPGGRVSFPDDYDVVSRGKIAEASGLDYVILVWPRDDGIKDPRRAWLPEIFVIRYEPGKFRYFPTVTLLCEASRLQEGGSDVASAGCEGLADMCRMDWDSLLDERYSADPTTRSFETDVQAPGNMYSWTELISKASLDADAEYFCVETWGLGPLLWFLDFHSVQEEMFEELKSGGVPGLLGCSKGGGITSGLGVKAETLTVWRERRNMVEFFFGAAHQGAMKRFRGHITFRSRKLWVRPEDLPDHADAESTRRFWERVKGKEFREA